MRCIHFEAIVQMLMGRMFQRPVIRFVGSKKIQRSGEGTCLDCCFPAISSVPKIILKKLKDMVVVFVPFVSSTAAGLFYVIVMKLLIWGRCIMSELRAAFKACTACRVNAQISTLCTIFHFAQEKKVQLLTYPRLDACPEHLRSRKSNIKQNHSFYPPPAHCTEDNH